MEPSNTTVIICCAGMGTRLGIGTTKALVDICGKPLIIHQLERLKEFDDIRIVVGFQAENVIKIVKEYRKDIMFAFNYNYENTGPATSLCKGLIGARKNIIYIDGDVLVNPDDLKIFLDYKGECISATVITSDEPILITVEKGQAIAFSEKYGNFEWPGLAKIEKKKLQKKDGYAFEMLQELLPLNTINVRAREIDTPEDYEKTIEWVKRGYLD